MNSTDDSKKSLQESTEKFRAQGLQEIENLISDLRRLRAGYASVPEKENILRGAETLEEWAKAYRRGAVPVDTVFVAGLQRLYNLRDQLKLTADEMQRLESEGGTPASKEQAEKVETLLKVVRGIEKVAPKTEQIFGKAQEHEAA